MDELVLPETLAGAWDSILILTYGAELPFFERTLARRLGDRCRNRVILADGHRYLESCAHWASGSLVHSLNQHYVADGVMTRQAMHAKAILLLASDAGRLLVGSGNLGFQGYASGGELFTRYEYTREQRDDLAAFVAIRELLETLTERRYLGATSVRHIELMLEKAPWLYQSAPGAHRQLRHNLHQSFFEQLQEEIAGDSVEELVLLAPFYDPEAKALDALLQAFSPARVELLVQPGRTSVNPTRLAALQQHHPALTVRPFRKGIDDPYVHAKLLLFKLPQRAIAFQGSANASQVALLLADPAGNVELANVATGARDAFDPLLDALEIGAAVSDVVGLDLKVEPIRHLPEQLVGFHLVRGELSGRTLRLEHRGALPSLKSASLLVHDDLFGFEVQATHPDALELTLTDEACERLQQAVAVRLRSVGSDMEWTSNPIYVCNRHALDRTLQGPTSSERLVFVGALGELDDEELEQLLAELADTVVIDHDDLRRLAREVQGGGSSPEAGEGETISYEEIDYELLRQHPKLKQYLLGSKGGAAERSRIQMVLQSITQHFRDYTHPEPSSHGLAALTIVDETDAETEEEVEEAAEASEQRRERTEQHLRLVFQNFIRRYLKGVTNPAFQRDAGFELVTQNYLIFSHVLWALLRKPWMPPRFLVDSLASVWEEFWRAPTGQPGYFDRLSAEDHKLAREWLAEHHAPSLLLASLYYCAYLTRIEEWEDARFRLRDLCGHLLTADQDGLSPADVPDSLNALRRLLVGKQPTTADLITELRALASFETRTSFLNSVSEELGLPAGTIHFDDALVMRPARRRQDKVICLSIDTRVDEKTVLALLARWKEFEPLGYYRIQIEGDSGPVCFFDVEGGSGVYWDRHNPAQELTAIPHVQRPWDKALQELGTAAEAAHASAR